MLSSCQSVLGPSMKWFHMPNFSRAGGYKINSLLRIIYILTKIRDQFKFRTKGI